MNTGREEVVLGYELHGLGISTYCKVKALGRFIGLFFGKDSSEKIEATGLRDENVV
jgi:hypothetical protein